MSDSRDVRLCWRDVQIEAMKMYDIVQELIDLEIAEQPQTEHTRFRIRQLRITLWHLNSIYKTINDCIEQQRKESAHGLQP